MTKWRHNCKNHFSEIFNCHKDQIYDFALKMLGDTDSAGDITQETFFRLYRELIDHRDIEHPRNWLFICARNLCLNMLRDNRKTIPLDACDIETTSEAIPKTVTVLRQAFYLLKIEDREILILKEYHGFSYREMAEILHCTVPAMRSRLYEARNRLRDIYGELSRKRCGL